MRNATILVIRLRGTATEAIKNIVLAGIGKLVIFDPEEVTEEDLGASFFFRDEDVGKKVPQSSFALRMFGGYLSVVFVSFLIESGCCEGSNRGTESACHGASLETFDAFRAADSRCTSYGR